MATERVEALKVELAAARARLLAALESAAAHQEGQIYSDGAGWTLRQLAIHLAIAERGIGRVIRQIAQGENPITPDYDVDRYNQRSVEKQADMTLDEAIEMLKAARAEFLAWLEGVDDATLERVGRHPQQLDLPLERFIAGQALHEASHAADIEGYVLRR